MNFFIDCDGVLNSLSKDSIDNIVAAQEIVTCFYYPTFRGL